MPAGSGAPHLSAPVVLPLLAMLASLGAATPPAPGEGFHVPLFVRAQQDLWVVNVPGETPIARKGMQPAIELVESTLGRCPAVSSVVVVPEPATRWWRTASMLVSLRRSGPGVALQGPSWPDTMAGMGKLVIDAHMQRVPARMAVVTLDNAGLAVDGEVICQLRSNTPLCGGDWRAVHAALGGRELVLLPAPPAPSGLVIAALDGLRDYTVHFGAYRPGSDRLRRFDVPLLPPGTPWVATPCRQPLGGP